MDIIAIATAKALAKKFTEKVVKIVYEDEKWVEQENQENERNIERETQQNISVVQTECTLRIPSNTDKKTEQSTYNPHFPHSSHFIVPDIANAKILQTVTMVGSETGWKAGWDLPESLFTINEPGFINMRVTVFGDGSHSLTVAYNPRMEITRQGITIQHSFSLNHPTNRERNTPHIQVIPGDIVRQFPSRHIIPPNRMIPHNSIHSLVFYPVLVVKL